MCRDFGYLVACTATGCNTQICYQRQDSAALPCLNDPSVGRFAKFRCPPCHRKQGTAVDVSVVVHALRQPLTQAQYKLNSPPNLSLARKLVPLLLVNVLAEGVSVYTQQMSNYHFQNAFGTSEEWVSGIHREWTC